MARPSLDQNPKFKLLVRRLGLPRPYVLGLLETMWRVAWENGEPVIGTPDEIEAAAEWPGEPGKFHAALVSGRLLDDVGDERWAVHDFWDHAPGYVQRRGEREAQRKARGQTIASVRAEAGRKGGLAKASKRVAKRSKRVAKVFTPAPAPAPAPAPVKTLRKYERRRFAPPAPEEVQAHITEKRYHFTAEDFIAYYASQGWKKANGRPVTDWKGCCRTWEKRERPSIPPSRIDGVCGRCHGANPENWTVCAACLKELGSTDIEIEQTRTEVSHAPTS